MYSTVQYSTVQPVKSTGCPKKPKTIEIIHCQNFNALALYKKIKYRCKVRFFCSWESKIAFAPVHGYKNS